MMNRLNAYRETKIKTASQGKLIVMLYDEAIRQIDFAVGVLDEKEKALDKVNSAIIKAQDVITELAVSLDFERGGDIAHNLFSLYMFFNQELLQGNIKKDVDPLRRVRNQLESLRVAWLEIQNKVSMNNHDSESGGINIAG